MWLTPQEQQVSRTNIFFPIAIGFPFLEQHRAAQNRHVRCCTKRQAAATPVFMPCDLATKADELKRADHGGYIHVSRRLLT